MTKKDSLFQLILVVFLLVSHAAAASEVNRDTLDRMLKQKWNSMKKALQQKDIGGALQYFTEQARPKYREIFGSIKDQLPAIIATFVEIKLGDVYDDWANYEVVANENGVLRLYPGRFAKCPDGEWRFSEF